MASTRSTHNDIPRVTPASDKPIHYLDHAASTPVRPVALEAMLPYLTTQYGNPSGAHRLARNANKAIDESRELMADLLGAQPGEVVFTGGGTEADNLAVFGTLKARPGPAVCSAVEHHAVIEPIENEGGSVVGVDHDGQIRLDELESALGDGVSLVSVMLANNETGLTQPLAAVAGIVREHAPQALLHTDAVQAFSWLDVAELGQVADLVSVSAHKFGGPQGVGVLVIRDSATLAARAVGGGQERGRRSGTQNVAGIVAMAAAAQEMVSNREAEVERTRRLRDRLLDGILDAVPGSLETGPRTLKTSNIAHLCFEDVESESLLFLLEKADVYASAAASCSSGAMEPSHVLAAMGFSRQLGFGSLRLSLGYTTSDADIDAVLTVLPKAVQQLRDSEEGRG